MKRKESGDTEPKKETLEEKEKVEKMRRKKKPFLPSQSSGESDSMINQTVSNFFGKTIRENSEEVEFGKVKNNFDNSMIKFWTRKWHLKFSSL